MTSLARLELPADQLPGEAVAVLFFEDQRPLRGPSAVLDWRLDGQLTRALLNGQLTGCAGEHAIFQSNAKLRADWVLFIGGGKCDGLCADTYATLVRHLLSTAGQAGFSNLSLCLPGIEDAANDRLFAMVGKELEKLNHDISACRLSTVEGLTV